MWTERTFYLGMGGLAVALLTLGAAAAAAYFAANAADHTDTGAQEAKRSADAAHAANRPWIAIEDFQIIHALLGPSSTCVEATYCLRNRGASPAVGVQSALVVSVLQNDGHTFYIDFGAIEAEKALDAMRDAPLKHGITIFPSGERKQRASTTDENTVFHGEERALQGGIAYVSFAARYMVGGKEGRTVDCFHLSLPPIATEDAEHVILGSQCRLIETGASYAT